MRVVAAKRRNVSILLDAWHESPLYSEREQAALAWTEALTLVWQTHVPDTVYDEPLTNSLK